MSEQIETLEANINTRVEKMESIDLRLGRQKDHIDNVIASRDRSLEHIERLKKHVVMINERIANMEERVVRQNEHLNKNINSGDKLRQEKQKLSDLNSKDMIALTELGVDKYAPVAEDAHPVLDIFEEKE